MSKLTLAPQLGLDSPRDGRSAKLEAVLLFQTKDRRGLRHTGCGLPGLCDVLAPSRLVCDPACYTWHLYVDASNVDDRAGIGGVLISENGSFIGHFSDFLEAEILNVLNPHLRTPFSSLSFAIWCGIETWSKLFRGRNLIVFTDNEGALNCMIHGTSKNDVGGPCFSKSP